MNKRKALVSFVGNNDPYGKGDPPQGKNKVSGPILALVEELNPQVVFLYPTDNGGENNDTISEAEKTREEIITMGEKRGETIEVFIKEMDVQGNPTDFTNLSKVIPDLIKEDIKNSQANHEICMNCSSGTPQMIAVLYANANSKNLHSDRLYQVIDPKYCSRPEEHIKEIKTEFLEEANAIERLREVHLDNWDFRSLARDCQNISDITKNKDRKDKAAHLAKLFLAIEELDLMNFNKAKKDWPSFSKYPIKDKSLKVKINEVKGHIDNLQKGQSQVIRETTQNLSELFFNMERCFHRGAYADVLSRFRRFIEGIMYYRLREVYDINPTEPKKSKDYSFLKEEDLSKPISFRLARSLLLKIKQDSPINSVAEKDISGKKIKDQIEKIVKKRNKNIVAHGMNPVSKEDADTAIKVAQEFLCDEMANGNDKFIDEKDYVLSKENLRAMIENMVG